MAKKKTTARARKAPKAKVLPMRKAKGPKVTAKGRSEKGPSRPKRAAQKPLPGMENLKDRVLSKLAKGVADERHNQAESQGIEANLLQAAQKRMQTLNATVFTDQGVEFVRVPGEEKFRCRLTKAKATQTSATEDEEAEDERPEPMFDTADDGEPRESLAEA